MYQRSFQVLLKLIKPNEGEYSDGKRNHINGLEGFWGYLKRRLVEYVWRDNHRNDSIQLQKKLILKQLERCHG